MKTDFKNIKIKELEGMTLEGFNGEIIIDGDGHKILWTWIKNKEGDKND